MYVDNILSISVNATKILKILEGNTVQYKNNKIASPDMYVPWSQDTGEGHKRHQMLDDWKRQIHTCVHCYDRRSTEDQEIEITKQGINADGHVIFSGITRFT